MKKRILLVAGATIGAVLVIGATLFAGANVVRAAARVGRDLITGRSGNLVQDVLQASTDQKGLVVVIVAADSPADKAGVKRGDIILQADSAEVNTNADLQKVLATKKLSDTLQLGITHGDSTNTVSATLTERNGKAYLGVVALGAEFGSGSRMFGKRGSGMPGFGFNTPISGTHVLVTEVVTDSPASRASIKVGDLILSVDGTALGTDANLSDIISGHKIGEKITLSVQHPGDANPTDVTVTLAENPNKAGAPFLGVQYRVGGGRMGMGGRAMPGFGPGGRQGRGQGQFPGGTTPITPTVPYTRNNSFTLPQRIPGAIIFLVTEGSPAANAGLQRSDVISEIDSKSVENAQALVDAIAAAKPSQEITLTVKHRSDAATTEIKVTLGENPDKSGTAYLGVSLGDAVSMPQMNASPGTANRGNNGRPGLRNPGTNPQQNTGSNGNTL